MVKQQQNSLAMARLIILLYDNSKKFETTSNGVKITGGLQDKDGQLGSSGQVLSSTGTQLNWIDAGSGPQGAQGCSGCSRFCRIYWSYRTHWSSTGAQGVHGATGSTGPAGSTGPQGADGGSVTVSTSAPGSASSGDLWWNSENGKLYVYYTDGDSTNQWVVSNNQGPVGPTGPQGATGATNPPSGTNIQLTDGFYTNDQALNSNKTLSGSLNGGVFGPYEIASGKTLTISSGATFTVL